MTLKQNELDVIVENESHHASTHGVLAAIEKHASETVAYASKRHSHQHRVAKRRSRTQVLTETDEKDEP